MRSQPFLGQTTLSDHLGWMSHCISCIAIRVNPTKVLCSCQVCFDAFSRRGVSIDTAFRANNRTAALTVVILIACWRLLTKDWR